MSPEASLRSVLVKDGSGFIGSNFIRYLLRQEDFSGRVFHDTELSLPISWCKSTGSVERVAQVIGDFFR
jgi:dTDP-D-glucose 4,6-dehydratase